MISISCVYFLLSDMLHNLTFIDSVGEVQTEHQCYFIRAKLF